MTSDLSIPAESTSFVGRRRELAQTRALLSAGRLVTLTGTGGVGKTRLALRAAEQVRRFFPDGVHLVALAALVSPDLVGSTAATEFGLRGAAEDPAAALAAFLRPKKLLLVLDNCEHVIEATADLVGKVLAATPDVRILATSRHPLGVDGEQVLRVRPLSVPEVPDLHAAMGLDAVALFADRAAAASGFRVDGSNWDKVVQFCRRLDGIPLAIELAVVWLRALALEQVLSRLDDRFRLLARGNQAAPTRQQTLAGAIEWSHNLCPPAEQLLWARLSVFRGGFDLAAAHTVCSGDGIDRDDVGALVAALVENSVLTPEHAVDGTRYRMLETIREFGRDRLREADGETATRTRHRDHYLAFAERGASDWQLGAQQPAVYARTQLEEANLRAALEFCFTTPGEAVAGLRLAVALPYQWLFGGRLSEGRYWLGQALEQNPEPSRGRASALWMSAYAAVLMGYHQDGLPLARECEAWALQNDDEVVLGFARLGLGGSAFLEGDFDRATELFQDIADRQHRSGEYTSALFLSYFTVAQSAVWAGWPEIGIEVAEEGLAICEATGEEWARTHLHHCLGLGLWATGQWERAERSLRDGLRIAEAFHEIIGVEHNLGMLISVVKARGRFEEAAELLGVATKVWPLAGGKPYMNFQTMIDLHEANERDVRAALDPAVYDAAFRHGVERSTTLRDAVACILGDHNATEAPERSADPGRSLTSRERQVAGLVAAGMSNREIAERLVISLRTAETHVNRVLGKFGVTSRMQLAARMAEDRHGV
jgi:non-specific serine/threonine protein kinase